MKVRIVQQTQEAEVGHEIELAVDNVNGLTQLELVDGRSAVDPSASIGKSGPSTMLHGPSLRTVSGTKPPPEGIDGYAAISIPCRP